MLIEKLQERLNILDMCLDRFGQIFQSDLSMHGDKEGEIINTLILKINASYSLSSLHHPVGVNTVVQMVRENPVFRDHVLACIEQFKAVVGSEIFTELTKIVSDYTMCPARGDWKAGSDQNLLQVEIPKEVIELRYPPSKDILSFYEANPFYLYFPLTMITYQKVSEIIK